MSKKVQCQIVTTTVSGRRTALALAHKIARSRLAACVQITAVHSIYRWKGAVESAAEFKLAAKTIAARAPALIAFIRRNHDYELPEITVQPLAGGLPGYLRWIAAETAPRRRHRRRG